MSRRALVLALSVTALVGAPLARPAYAAAPPPDVQQFLDQGPGAPAKTWDWARYAGYQTAGKPAGRPGNWHTFGLVLTGASEGTNDLRFNWIDSRCGTAPPPDPGRCTTLSSGHWDLHETGVVRREAADGTLAFDIPLTRGTFTVDSGTAPGGRLKVTLTPVGWKDPRNPTRASTSSIQVSRGPGGSRTHLMRSASGATTKITGSVAGYKPGTVLSDDWATNARADGGNPVRNPPVTTAAEAAAYRTPVVNGKLAGFTIIDLSKGGPLAGRAPLVTSTGFALPGNTYAISRLVFGPRDGDPVTGPLEGVRLELTAQQCTASGDCTPIDYTDHIEFGAGAGLRYDVTDPTRVKLTGPVTVTDYDAGGIDRGTLDLSVDLGPGPRAGVGSRDVTETGLPSDPSWSESLGLTYTGLTGTLRLGGRAATPGPDSTVLFGTARQG